MSRGMWSRNAGVVLGMALVVAGCPTTGDTDTTSSSSSSSSGTVSGGSSGVASGSSSSSGAGSTSSSTSSSSGGGSSDMVASSGAGASSAMMSSSGAVSGTTSGMGSSSSSSSSSGGGSSSMMGSSSSEPVLPIAESIVDCGRVLTPPATGTCTVTAGNGNTLLEGTVLAGTRSLRGGQVLVGTNGNILCAACNCEDNAAATGATRVTCANGVITPGLINAHDHLTYNQEAPYVPAAIRAHERYEHRNDWRSGDNGHFEVPYSNGGDNGSRQGELRQVLGGTTSINGSNGAQGMCRNPDQANAKNEGLTGGKVFYDVFPLGTSQRLDSGCGYSTKPSASDPELVSAVAYTPHISEGIDLDAYNEFQCLSRTSGGAVDVILAKTGVIHGVGLRAADYGVMAADFSSLIWSPRSNVSLYGHTAQTPMAHRLGVNIALGTDWTPSGSINLLRELACVRDLNARAFDGYFNDRDLWLMVTANGARALGIQNQVGRLAPGLKADIAIFRGDDPAGTGVRRDWRAVVEAHQRDVALVMRSGLVLTGDKAIMEGFTAGAGCEQVDVCGVEKRVCAMREFGRSAQQVIADATEYAIIHCADVPANEPTCVPSRPPPPMGSGSMFNTFPFVPGDPSVDEDGDGIPDGMDNCPGTFNPPRPMDGTMQPDFDGDMAGDACDVCPLNPGETCTPPNPNDRDADGRDDAMDNCPAVYNPMQENSDSDEKGDACDFCPMETNMGDAPCTANIYQVKRGQMGGFFSLTNVLVTAVGPTGYFVRHLPGEITGEGDAFSGLFVYTGTGNKPAVGARVSMATGSLTTFSGQMQYQNAPFTVVTPMDTLPGPIPVMDPASIAPGGANAAALESLLVEVTNVTVVDPATCLAPGQTPFMGEFFVTGCVRVANYLHTVMPTPAVGDPYAFIRGVLRTFNNTMKLEPRDATDLGGAIRLTGFTPAQAFVNEGDMMVSALQVSLNRAAETDTFVTITSSEETALTVVGGGATIPAGQTSAPVLVNGLAQSLLVTLTASLDPVMLTAGVRVVGAMEVPVLESIRAERSLVLVNGTTPVTVTLDLPAPTGGLVVDLAVDAGGTLPANVTIPAGERSATVDFTAGASAAMATLSASIAGGTPVTTSVEVSAGLPANVVISQVYGGGGNTGAPYRNDFVELFNAGGLPQDLSGWTVQQTSASGSTWNVTTLNGTLLPGQYYLVQQAAGTNMSAPALPTPDATGNAAMGGAGGKIVLVRAASALTGECPSVNVQSFVGYGAANCSEVMPTAVTSNTMGARRKANGCSVTGNNSMDFEVVAPTPRNTASPVNTCN